MPEILNDLIELWQVVDNSTRLLVLVGLFILTLTLGAPLMGISFKRVGVFWLTFIVVNVGVYLVNAIVPLGMGIVGAAPLAAFVIGFAVAAMASD